MLCGKGRLWLRRGDPPRPARPARDIGVLLTDGLTTAAIPRARGWIHVCCAVLAVAGGFALLQSAAYATSPRAFWSVGVYVCAVVAMFSVSATYHRVTWASLHAEKWMMRLDHSVIFVFIAASYTPFALLAMPPEVGARVLVIVWSGAAVGVTLKLFWPAAPRWVGVPPYLMLGYVAIWFAETLLDGAGAVVVALLIAGGVLYNIGAVLYGLRWPNPWPATFGHHEFFHAFTAAAAACHFAAIWLVVG